MDSNCILSGSAIPTTYGKVTVINTLLQKIVQSGSLSTVQFDNEHINTSLIRVIVNSVANEYTEYFLAKNLNSCHRN